MPPRIPAPLAELLESLDLLPDRNDRIALLLDLGERFREVPPEVARRPFAGSHRVPGCESEAFVWASPRGDGTFDLHFAVENPQGVSAKSLAVLLARGLSGQPVEEVLAVPQDVVYRIFGRELSMGKSMGLMGMVTKAQSEIRRQVAGTGSAAAGSNP